MATRSMDLMPVGAAAVLLRVPRQRVVDLCVRGLLPSVRVGGARRVHRADVEALARSGLSRPDLEALWLHRAVAARLATDPGAVLAAAAINLRRLRRWAARTGTGGWVDRWEAVLDQGADAVREALTSPGAWAVALRRTSPFAGVLSEQERAGVLAAYAESRRDHARPVPPDRLERILSAV